MAVQGENTVFMFNYEKIEWTKPTSSPGCHEEITVCPNIGALVSNRSGTVNSESFVGKVLLQIKRKFELINAL